MLIIQIALGIVLGFLMLRYIGIISVILLSVIFTAFCLCLFLFAMAFIENEYGISKSIQFFLFSTTAITFFAIYKYGDEIFSHKNPVTKFFNNLVERSKK